MKRLVSDDSPLFSCAFLNTNGRHLMRLVGASNAILNYEHAEPLLSCFGNFAILQSVAWYNIKRMFFLHFSAHLPSQRPAAVSKSPSSPESFSNLNYWRDPFPKVDFPVLTSTFDLEAMDEFFSSRSYVVDYTLSASDIVLLDELFSSSLNLKKYPHISRWSRHIAALQKTDLAQVDIKLSAGRGIFSTFQRRRKVGDRSARFETFFAARIGLVCSFCASSRTRTPP